MNEYFEIDKSKRAIKSGEVFEGLAVDDRAKFKKLFLMPQFQLVSFTAQGIECGWAIFEIVNNSFVFHLVNFTKVKCSDMTGKFLKSVVKPVCAAHELDYIQASVERRGMARKLTQAGFRHYSGQVYRGEVGHVFK